MNKVILSVLLILSAASYSEAATNVDINLNIGTPQVVVRDIPPQTHYDDPPEFLFSTRLGFHIAIGIPLDIVYIDGIYWMYRDNGWHRGNSYNGPWYRVKHKHIPWGLRNHDIVVIREQREHERIGFTRDHDSYKGRHFRPEHHFANKNERMNARGNLRSEEGRKWVDREERKERKEHGRRDRD